MTAINTVESEKTGRAAAQRSPQSASGTPQSPLDLLDRIGSTVSVERDHAIFFEGDSSNYYFKVLSGTVRLVRMLADGRRQIVEFLYPSQFFGFVPSGQYRVTAEAVTPVTLVRYSRKTVDDLVATRPSFAKFVLDFASEELRMAQEQMVLLGRRTAKERLAVFLLDVARRSRCDADRNRAHLSMCRRDIADYLGLTIETVCRIIGQLKQGGLIQLLTTDDILFLKPRALAELTD